MQLKFRDILILILTAIVLSACGKSYSTRFYAPADLRRGIAKVAILPFNEISGAEGSSRVVEGFFAEELRKIYGIEVLEGEGLKSALSDKRFEGEETSDRLTASKVAQLLPVDAVVYGAVLEYKYRKWMSSSKGVSEDPVVCIGARLLNGKTGTVIWAETVVKNEYGLVSNSKNQLTVVAQKVVHELSKSMKLNKK